MTIKLMDYHLWHQTPQADTHKKYFNAYQNSKNLEQYMEYRISEITLYQEAEWY